MFADFFDSVRENLFLDLINYCITPPNEKKYVFLDDFVRQTAASKPRKLHLCQQLGTSCKIVIQSSLFRFIKIINVILAFHLFFTTVPPANVRGLYVLNGHLL